MCFLFFEALVFFWYWVVFRWTIVLDGVVYRLMGTVGLMNEFGWWDLTMGIDLEGVIGFLCVFNPPCFLLLFFRLIGRVGNITYLMLERICCSSLLFCISHGVFFVIISSYCS